MSYSKTMVHTMKCVVCHTDLDPVLESEGTHPACSQYGDVGQVVKSEMLKIIRWADRNSPRSKQLAVGPSELGDPCDRRIAYRIAGNKKINFRPDPWAGIVGTATHAWLENAINAFQEAHGTRVFAPELPVQPDPVVRGRSDVYSAELATVVDFKCPGPDVMHKIKKTGTVPDGYKIQVQLYGLGHANAGRPVRFVGLFFLPRAGWMKDAIPWFTPFQPEVAQAALARLYRIAGSMTHNGHPGSQDWQAIPNEPSANGCWYCPFYNPDQDSATDEGCPGK